MNIERKVMAQVKSALTRAEKSQDPSTMRAAADQAESAFKEYGWPDWWSRIERMRIDAAFLEWRRR